MKSNTNMTADQKVKLENIVNVMKAEFGDQCHRTNIRADIQEELFDIPTDIIINAFK